jgi:hypothetical protein
VANGILWVSNLSRQEGALNINLKQKNVVIQPDSMRCQGM